jgi:hypothetical protein
MTVVSRLHVKSRLMSLLVIMALLSFGMSASFATEGEEAALPPLPGSGTLEIPYEISDCQDLQRINENLNKNYILTDNIDCSGSSAFNDGAGFEPLGTFLGDYIDGRNFSIVNLAISRASTDSLAFITNLNERATIKNISFENITVTNTSTEEVVSNRYTSTVVGTNAGRVENVYSYGFISSPGNVGGVVGHNIGTISRATSNVSLTDDGHTNVVWGGIASHSSGSISDTATYSSPNFNSSLNAVCGGVVGNLLENGSVSNSFVEGIMKCPGTGNHTGGIVGSAGVNTSITNSFVALLPNHNTFFKGTILGHNYHGIDISTNAYDASLLGSTNCDDAQSSCIAVNSDGNDPNYFFTNTNAPLNTWDFANTWQTTEGDYPGLRTGQTLPHLSTQVSGFTYDATSATLTWNPPNGSNGALVTNYEIIATENVEGLTATIDYGSTNVWNQVALVSGDQLSYTVTGLDPSVQYDLRVRAFNEAGAGLPSYPYRVKAVPSIATDLSSTQSSSRSVSLQWTQPSTDVTDTTVEYKKSSETEWTGSTTVGASTSTRILPLDSETTYDFRVASMNERGTAAASSIVTASTTAIQSYTISSCQELQDIDDDLYGDYTLTNDIDCTETQTWNDGAGFAPIGLSTFDSFAGNLDGAGHTISNVYMNRFDLPSGLFYGILGSTIENLTISGGQFNGTRANDGTVYTDAELLPLSEFSQRLLQTPPFLM